MKKVLVSVSLIATFAVLPVTAQAAPVSQSHAVQRVPAWDPLGNYVIDFSCVTCVPHAITIDSYDPYTGIFTGDGTYTANPAFSWTLTGKLIGNTVTMHITYTGAQAGYYVDLVGTVTPDGDMLGSAVDSSGGRFSWTMTGRAREYANHGQFVASQGGGRIAARSDFGMPTRN